MVRRFASMFTRTRRASRRCSAQETTQRFLAKLVVVSRAMAKKARKVFSCGHCGHTEPKWLGRCPGCDTWGSLIAGFEAEQRAPSRINRRSPGEGSRPVPLGEVGTDRAPRRSTGIEELDRVLGGGIVPGSMTLIGGDPGIGKSTLLLAASASLCSHGKVLYASGEESLAQTRMRADRLGLSSKVGDQLFLLAETDGERVLAEAEAMQPTALVIDSIQTLHLPELGSAPGSVAQVRELTAVLLGFAKRTGTPTFLVGHVTKDGAIAGPKVLEHMVDTVLYFEGDRYHAYRILRAHKNRFGSVSEIGVFEMREEGLVEVADPSAVFLAERPQSAAGSIVTSSLSGSRPVLVEIQVLANSCQGGAARRTSVGVDHVRVALLAAVLEKHLGLCLSDQDLFVNVAGGLSLDEPAVDLAVALAMASSVRNKPCDPSLIVTGEVGLAGEVRSVNQVELRLIEAAKMGFSTAIVPEGNQSRLGKTPPMLIRGVRTLEEAVEATLEM